jgi:methyl-accepting chemotaxis protein
MKETKPIKYKRKKLNLSVKSEFQRWLLVRIIGVVVVSTLVAVVILYFYSRQEISASFYSAHIQIRRVSDLLLPVIAAGASISLLSGIILALFLPQKIAGPIFRIQKALETIGTGDLTEHIVLRQHSTFQDLAEAVNDTTTNLRTRVNAVKEIQQELDKLLSDLENEEARSLLIRQKKALARLQTERND